MIGTARAETQAVVVLGRHEPRGAGEPLGPHAVAERIYRPRDAAAALSLLKAETITLAVVDEAISVPAVLEFLAEARGLPRPVPVVVISSRPTVHLAVRFVRAGARARVVVSLV